MCAHMRAGGGACICRGAQGLLGHLVAPSPLLASGICVLTSLFLCFAPVAPAKSRCQILHPGSADAGAAFTSKSCISLLSPEERHEFCISSPTKPCFTSSRIKWLPGRRKDSGTERGSANGSSRNLSRAPRATHGAVRVLTARYYGHHHRVYVMSLLVGLTQPRQQKICH